MVVYIRIQEISLWFAQMIFADQRRGISVFFHQSRQCLHAVQRMPAPGPFSHIAIVDPAMNSVLRGQLAGQQRGAAGRAKGIWTKGIVESQAPAQRAFEPHHPMANEEGYVFYSNVNSVEEMADMISASRSYQTNVQLAESAKNMLNKTLTLGKS